MAGDALKAAYNGTFRGKVVAAPGGRGGLWVIVPRLNGNNPMGPCQHLGTAAPAKGADVLVATISGVKDDIVILGTLTTGSVAADTGTNTGSTPTTGSTAPDPPRASGGTLCPFAKHRLMPYNDSMPARADSPTLILHTNGGGSDHGSLYGFFAGRSDHVCSHFQIMNDGTIEQYITLDKEAYAEYAGNAFGVAVETQDDGNPSRPWTAAQINSIVRLAKWIGVPARTAPDGPGGGVGWHEQYTDWNHDGHACPGAVREAQITGTIIPRLAA